MIKGLGGVILFAGVSTRPVRSTRGLGVRSYCCWPNQRHEVLRYSLHQHQHAVVLLGLEKNPNTNNVVVCRGNAGLGSIAPAAGSSPSSKVGQPARVWIERVFSVSTYLGRRANEVL